MSSKAYITFYVILYFVAVIFGHILKLTPVNTDFKRSLHHGDALQNFTGSHLGFTSEEHTVITEDGYILTIFRIRASKCKKLRRPPVILMHGLLQNSDSWFDAGPDAGLPYLISDVCYDLWVGNQRGNSYSRRHVRLDPDREPEFWKYSIGQIGYYDIPATIDYVLKYTNEKKLNYIGYSQGSGTFFIMCSERPGYCDKANILIGLAPATMLVRGSAAVQLMLDVVLLFQDLLAAFNINEFPGKGTFLEYFLLFSCHNNKPAIAFCDAILTIIDSPHPGYVKKETVRKLFQNFPYGASIQLLAHYGQIIKAGRFQNYDYGKRENLKRYQAEQPPIFNFSAVTVPFVTLYGRNDNLVKKESMLWLIQQLPNVVEAVEVSDPLWNHFDVAYSQFTKKSIFPKIKEYLDKFSRN